MSSIEFYGLRITGYERTELARKVLVHVAEGMLCKVAIGGTVIGFIAVLSTHQIIGVNTMVYMGPEASWAIFSTSVASLVIFACWSVKFKDPIHQRQTQKLNTYRELPIPDQRTTNLRYVPEPVIEVTRQDEHIEQESDKEEEVPLARKPRKNKENEILKTFSLNGSEEDSDEEKKAPQIPLLNLETFNNGTKNETPPLSPDGEEGGSEEDFLEIPIKEQDSSQKRKKNNKEETAPADSQLRGHGQYSPPPASPRGQETTPQEEPDDELSRQNSEEMFVKLNGATQPVKRFSVSKDGQVDTSSDEENHSDTEQEPPQDRSPTPSPRNSISRDEVPNEISAKKGGEAIAAEPPKKEKNSGISEQELMVLDSDEFNSDKEEQGTPQGQGSVPGRITPPGKTRSRSSSSDEGSFAKIGGTSSDSESEDWEDVVSLRHTYDKFIENLLPEGEIKGYFETNHKKAFNANYNEAESLFVLLVHCRQMLELYFPYKKKDSPTEYHDLAGGSEYHLFLNVLVCSLAISDKSHPRFQACNVDIARVKAQLELLNLDFASLIFVLAKKSYENYEGKELKGGLASEYIKAQENFHKGLNNQDLGKLIHCIENTLESLKVGVDKLFKYEEGGDLIEWMNDYIPSIVDK